MAITRKMISFAGIGAMLLTVAACKTPTVTHKLIVTGNQHSVPLYSDEHAYLTASRMSQQGGVQGMIGDVDRSLTAKKIDDQTPVQIVSSDDNGAVVTITGGPMKGQTGFVAKQNVD